MIHRGNHGCHASKHREASTGKSRSTEGAQPTSGLGSSPPFQLPGCVRCKISFSKHPWQSRLQRVILGRVVTLTLSGLSFLPHRSSEIPGMTVFCIVPWKLSTEQAQHRKWVGRLWRLAQGRGPQQDAVGTCNVASPHERLLWIDATQGR